jgi:hypothetical protein
MGLSLLGAFNPASQQTVSSAGYHPLLDDDGDGVGHGWDTPAGSGYLPHDGDGYLAANVYLDPSVWVYPQIDSVVAKQFYAWPPPTTVNLWAEVENDTPLRSVTAWMLPPDWSPPPPDNVLIQAPLIPFNMTELDGSGNWTVNIPVGAFTAHASGPSNFRFMITAEEANSSAIPFWTAVEFTSTGLPPPDTTPPQVDILRPIDMQPANGTVVINGTATDDVCLQRLELYVNSSLADVVNVPPESSCFFQFAYNLSGLSPTEFTVKAFDTSGNSGNQTVRVNTIRDVAVTNLTLGKTVVGQGCLLPMNVTVANEGQLTEAFKVIVYANQTLVNTTTVTLESGASTTLAFAWNTTGVAYGRYIIKAVASPLPYEINLANNEMDGTVQIVPRYYLTVVSPYDTPGGMGWYDNGTTAYATLTTGTVDIIPGWVRAVFTGWSGDASGTGLMSNPITMDGPKTAVANWVIQYYLDVVTRPSNLPPIPGADWYDNCTWVKLTAPQYVPNATGVGGVRYDFTYWDVDGASQGIGVNPINIHVNEPHVATAHFVLQYNVTFAQTGVGSDFTGTVVTVDGMNYDRNGASFWCDSGSIHTFAFQSPLVVPPDAKQYDWKSTSGLSTSQSGSINVTGPGSVTGNYVTLVHDVAVTSVTLHTLYNRSYVYQGNTAKINVTVWDNGDFTENVTVTLYYNITGGNLVGVHNVTLTSGQSATLLFVWNTAGVTPCYTNYTLTAVATIPADYTPADNTLSDGHIKVRIPGDINGDGRVDMKDIGIIAAAFGSYGPNYLYPGSPPSPRWNPDADINGDGKVNMLDVAYAARNFGKRA